MTRTPSTLQTLLGLAIVFLPLAGWAQTSQGSRMSARELFYAALPERPSRPAAPAAAVTPKTPASRPAKPAAPQTAVRVEPQAPKVEAPAPRMKVPEADIVKAADIRQTSGSPALGLRYSLLKSTTGKRYEEVSVDTVFHSGDKLRLAVEANDRSYLYIVQKGSSGAWSLLFPDARVNDGDNRVQPGRQYVIPGGARFSFDEQPGEERLFVILSRTPVQDIDGLIYSLTGSGAQTPPVKDAEPQKDEKPEMRILMASNEMPNLGDGLIQRIRNEVRTRDLVFEKIDEDEESAEKPKEHAVYVVNAQNGGRVTADVTLIHK